MMLRWISELHPKVLRGQNILPTHVFYYFKFVINKIFFSQKLQIEFNEKYMPKIFLQN